MGQTEKIELIPGGSQSWRMIKLSHALIEQANLEALLARVRTFKTEAGIHAFDEQCLNDTIETLEASQANLKKYIQALENTLPLE